MKRKTLGKKLRFDVFKRDRFTCAYCGRTPPTVLLVIDHVTPIANGGDDAPDNLVTSCEECNQGKGARELTSVPRPLADQIEDRRERADQIEEYNRVLMELRQRDEQVVISLGHYWYNKFIEKQNAWVFNSTRLPTIRNFLRILPAAEIIEAMDIAHDRFYGFTDWKDPRELSAWRYFCGVCWRRIRRLRGEESED